MQLHVPRRVEFLGEAVECLPGRDANDAHDRSDVGAGDGA